MIVALLGVVVYLLRDRLSKVEPIRNLLFLAAAGLALVTGSLGGKMTHGQEHESANKHRVSDESERLGQDPENLLHRRIEPSSIGNHSDSREFDGPNETTTKAPIHGSDGHGHEHNHEH